MKYIANIITTLRIIASAFMIFTAPLSVWFFVCYAIGGVSDMVDGTIARKLGTAGSFGARLDSIADFVFFLISVIKLLPALFALFPLFSLWAAVVVFLIKTTSAIIGYVKFRVLCFLHTYMNKFTGLCVFLLPFFYSFSYFRLVSYIACEVAFLAATEELICMIKMKKYNPEIRGL